MTFNDKLNITANDEDVAVFNISNAHMDGDSILYFTQSNILHNGVTYFNDSYLCIDLKSGSSING